MLRFVGPALFIYLANPVMTNIDNAFVGRFSGTKALAALSPGGVLADNFLYIFASVLGSATTGLVARAWAKGDQEARAELTRTVSFALVIGVPLTLFYVFGSSWALKLMGLPQEIHSMASSYSAIRGAVTWATLAQGVCLSGILATRDAVTPLKVVLVAAALNLTGDILLCCWPFRGGVSGAAAATAISTLMGCTLMLKALRDKNIQPGFEWPTRRSIGPVLEYAGPMLVITGARVAGFTAMAFAAASAGLVQLAAYQVIIGIFSVMAFVGGPLSQTAQSLVPAMVDSGDTQNVRKIGSNLLILAIFVSSTVTVVGLMLFRFGIAAFTSDAAVVAEVMRASPAVLLALASLIFASPLDGSLVAAKDFGFIVPQQLAVLCMQLVLLKLLVRFGYGLRFIFSTYTMSKWWFLLLAVLRIRRGHGPLGRVMYPSEGESKDSA